MNARRNRSTRSTSLIDSKWTAVAPTAREKHFIVTRVLDAGAEGSEAPSVELEAVISKRRRIVARGEIEDSTIWRRGWL